MSIAALNAQVLSDIAELSNLETARMIIDQRRESLAYIETDLYTDYTAQYQLQFSNDSDSDTDTSSISSSEWQQFYADYQNEVAKLDAQDKRLERERANYDTKIEAIQTAQESMQKMLEKNIETDMKGIQ